MTYRRSCETESPPSRETCIHCGADLLPGPRIGRRLESIGAGIAGGLVSAALLCALGQNGGAVLLLPSPQALLIGVVVLPAAGLVSGCGGPLSRDGTPFGRGRTWNPIHSRRLADFGLALDLAPDKAYPSS